MQILGIRIKNNSSHNKGPQEKYNIWKVYLHEGATKLCVLQYQHLQRTPPTTNKHTNFFYKYAIVISRQQKKGSMCVLRHKCSDGKGDARQNKK